MGSLTIERLLGGTDVIGHPIHSEMDLYELGKDGPAPGAVADIGEEWIEREIKCPLPLAFVWPAPLGALIFL